MSQARRETRWVGMLRSVGLKATSTRLEVIGVLEEKREALTAKQIYRHISRRERGPGLATIYRTLSVLTEAGYLDIFSSEGEQAYRICGPGHHHHLVCRSCGSVEEEEAPEIERWVARIARRRRFTVTDHLAEIYGYCSSCHSKGRA